MSLRPRSLTALVLSAIGLLATPGPAAPITAVLEGDSVTEDTTLYSFDPDGNAGAFTGFFVGRPGGTGEHRALLRFDLSTIPSGASIESVTLRARIDRSPSPGVDNVHSLHRVTADWVEGAGVGSGIGGGAGGTVDAGAATWDSREHPTVAWTSAGGDFVGAASASTSVGTGLGQIIWSGPGLEADAQAWVDGTDPNFGWILLGETFSPRTSRRYSSSESSINPPQLTVEYSFSTSPVQSWSVYR